MLDDEHQLVRRARADAARFFADQPQAPWFEHTYPPGAVRVRVLRSPGAKDGLRVLVFDAKGHRLGDPVWDSDNPS